MESSIKKHKPQSPPDTAAQQPVPDMAANAEGTEQPPVPDIQPNVATGATPPQPEVEPANITSAKVSGAAAMPLADTKKMETTALSEGKKSTNKPTEEMEPAPSKAKKPPTTFHEKLLAKKAETQAKGIEAATQESKEWWMNHAEEEKKNKQIAAKEQSKTKAKAAKQKTSAADAAATPSSSAPTQAAPSEGPQPLAASGSSAPAPSAPSSSAPSAPSTSAEQSAAANIASDQDLTGNFAPAACTGKPDSGPPPIKDAFIAADYILPAITLKKVKQAHQQAQDRNQDTKFLAVLSLATQKAYRVERQTASKMVLADMNKYAGTYWERVSAHFGSSTVAMAIIPSDYDIDWSSVTSLNLEHMFWFWVGGHSHSYH